MPVLLLTSPDSSLRLKTIGSLAELLEVQRSSLGMSKPLRVK
jgi:hypothetical protein